MLKHDELLEILKNKVAKTSGEQVAKELGITASYVSLLLNEKRDISARIARKLGYEWHACKATFTKIK